MSTLGRRLPPTNKTQLIGGSPSPCSCSLCGSIGAAVKCEKCGNQIFCLSCDHMYHRHPKRRFHLRKPVVNSDLSNFSHNRSNLLEGNERTRNDFLGPRNHSAFDLRSISHATNVKRLDDATHPSKMPIPPPRKKKNDTLMRQPPRAGSSVGFAPATSDFLPQPSATSNRRFDGNLALFGSVQSRPSAEERQLNQLRRKGFDTASETFYRQSLQNVNNLRVNANVQRSMAAEPLDTRSDRSSSSLNSENQTETMQPPPALPLKKKWTQTLPHRNHSLTDIRNLPMVAPPPPPPPNYHSYIGGYMNQAWSPYMLNPYLASWHSNQSLAQSFEDLNFDYDSDDDESEDDDDGESDRMATLTRQRTLKTRKANMRRSKSSFLYGQPMPVYYPPPPQAAAYYQQPLPFYHGKSPTPSLRSLNMRKNRRDRDWSSRGSSRSRDLGEGASGCGVTERRHSISSYQSDVDIHESDDSDDETDSNQSFDVTKPWPCRSCTFVNKAASKICEMCSKSNTKAIKMSKKSDKNKMAEKSELTNELKITEDLVQEQIEIERELKRRIENERRVERENRRLERRQSRKKETGEFLEILEDKKTLEKTIDESRKMERRNSVKKKNAAESEPEKVPESAEKPEKIDTEEIIRNKKMPKKSSGTKKSRSKDESESKSEPQPIERTEKTESEEIEIPVKPMETESTGQLQPNMNVQYPGFTGFQGQMIYDPYYPWRPPVSPGQFQYQPMMNPQGQIGHYPTSCQFTAPNQATQFPDVGQSQAQFVGQNQTQSRQTENKNPLTDGFEMFRILREAEHRGFTADDVEVAMTFNPSNPLEWLDENWPNMMETVLTLSNNQLINDDKKRYSGHSLIRDLKLVTESDAKCALRKTKGNIWQAIEYCVRQQTAFVEKSTTEEQIKNQSAHQQKTSAEESGLSANEPSNKHSALKKATEKPHQKHGTLHQTVSEKPSSSASVYQTETSLKNHSPRQETISTEESDSSVEKSDSTVSEPLNEANVQHPMVSTGKSTQKNSPQQQSAASPGFRKPKHDTRQQMTIINEESLRKNTTRRQMTSETRVNEGSRKHPTSTQLSGECGEIRTFSLAVREPDSGADNCEGNLLLNRSPPTMNSGPIASGDGLNSRERFFKSFDESNEELMRLEISTQDTHSGENLSGNCEQEFYDCDDFQTDAKVKDTERNSKVELNTIEGGEKDNEEDDEEAEEEEEDEQDGSEDANRKQWRESAKSSLELADSTVQVDWDLNKNQSENVSIQTSAENEVWWSSIELLPESHGQSLTRDQIWTEIQAESDGQIEKLPVECGSFDDDHSEAERILREIDDTLRENFNAIQSIEAELLEQEPIGDELQHILPVSRLKSAESNEFIADLTQLQSTTSSEFIAVEAAESRIRGEKEQIVYLKQDEQSKPKMKRKKSIKNERKKSIELKTATAKADNQNDINNDEIKYEQKLDKEQLNPYFGYARNQFECELCAGQFNIRDMINLIACQHKACRWCLSKYFAIAIKEKPEVIITCPFCDEPKIDIDDDCDDKLFDYISMLEQMVKSSVDEQLYQLFQRKVRDKVLAKDPAFRWCRQCSSGFIASNPCAKTIICPDCRTVTCAMCNKVWQEQHLNLNCDEFNEWKKANDPEFADAQLESHLKKFGIDCPNCQFHYELSKGGCMHFHCVQCSHDFCGGCQSAFRMGAKCTVSPWCEKLGLHAHHPRNCLFYLRDKEVDELRKLLDIFTIEYEIKVSDNSDKMCKIMEQKEFPDGLRDLPCGNVADNSGVCTQHYVEYLGELIFRNNVDPIEIFTEEELISVLRRENLRIPTKIDSNKYRQQLIEMIRRDCPLAKISA